MTPRQPWLDSLALSNYDNIGYSTERVWHVFSMFDYYLSRGLVAAAA